MKKRSEAGRSRGEVPEREIQLEIPHDVINEMAVLAAMLVDVDVAKRLIPVCPTSAFYAEEHQVIRDVIEEAIRKGLPFDAGVLARLNPDVDSLRIEKLIAARPEVPEQLDHYVETLLWDRQLAEAARGPVSSLLEAMKNPKHDREDVCILARRVGEAFSGEGGKHILAGGDVVRQAVTEVARRAKGDAIYPYGIEGLDKYEDGEWRMIPGAAPGGFTLISALSGSGKSLLMSHLAISAARQRRKVLFGSWEDEAHEMLEQMTILALRWSRGKTLRGLSSVNRMADGSPAPLSPEELIRFEETSHKIAGWITFFKNPFRYGDRLPTGRAATNDDHLDIIENEISKSGCDAFMADLLQRGLVNDSPSEERKALYRMRHIVQQSRTHAYAAHQQRAKDIEARPDKKPTREGIIGAGAWLDVPRAIIAPHLPAKWKNVPDDTMEIYILKQSKGAWPLGVEFDYDPDTGQITNGRSFDVRANNDSNNDSAFETAPARREKHRAKKPFGSRRR